jgi:ribosomal-protein-alanine N-acetyltransferase
VQFTIRDYRSADFDRLWQIDQLCFPDGIAYTQMDLTGFIGMRNAVTLVAEAQSYQPDRSSGPAPAGPSPIAGFVVAHRVRGATGRIVTLDVVPEVRRRGLASRLMQEAAVNNEPGLRLYHKLGYEIVRTLPEYYSSQSLDAFQLRKSISQN